MKICLNVGIGCGKAECEDTAVFNNTLVNDKLIELDSETFLCAGVADGVGGNAGGRIASRYIAHQVSQADFLSMTPVSYTHLDVYKRQVSDYDDKIQLLEG